MRMTGGCQCGRVRYVAEVTDDSAYLCHCRMCRQATGSVSIAFCNLLKTRVTWEREPERYSSSPIAKRGFCAVCGTSLTFEFRDGPNMDLTVGSFDDPSRFVPNHHFGIESRLDHWRAIDDLPGERADEHAATIERWMKTVGKLPD